MTALQSIVARNVDPMDTAVVSTTQIHAGDTWNVIPQECTLRGTVRTFKKPVQDMIERRIEKIARNVAAGFGAEVIKWRYERRYPATVNSEQETEFAAKAAAALVGLENVNRNPTPAMGSEDFAWMLLKRPGCYIWIGNGDGARQLHGPQPGLRLQRRDPADRRVVLGDPGRAAARAPGHPAGGDRRSSPSIGRSAVAPWL